jgi:UDP-N-acetylmuramoylalanine--D-glutamate ligase
LGALFAMGIEENILEKWMSKNRDAICIENEHRCEFVASIRGVDFYNDSKATVIQSTEAAVGRFASSGRPIILILGGLSKGVDRSPLINQLANIKNIKKIYCFGKECAVFSQISSYCTTLEGVIEDIEKIMVAGDLVLLSPSGTSYDLYKNYEERGTVFKMLVKNLCSH